MRILLTGATGYIGKRLLPALVEEGHEIIACVRDKSRFPINPVWEGNVTVYEVDLLEEVDLETAPKDFDVAYYLIHSMTSKIGGFEQQESTTAHNFIDLVEASNASQVIYLTGISNHQDTLSKHLESRYNVEKILAQSPVPLTALRAGIVIGSGSASFEIVRDLVEKLPVMIAPKWLKTRTQPIGITNVLDFLTGVLGEEKYFGKSFDVGCGETLTYESMLRTFAEVRGLKRYIFTVPIMTPRLSSYWLYFITSTSYNLAVNLVDSMKIDIIGKPNTLAEELGIDLLTYRQSVEVAFSRIEQNAVVSSWKDSFASSLQKASLQDYINVPTHGCLQDYKERDISNNSVEQVFENVWSIGGKRGWYYGNFLWKIRGYMDKLAGGIGLRRGRTNPGRLRSGDALDFWRVILADEENMRLLLFAEMKLPGEAWLEFEITKKDGRYILRQTATFRPWGILGRLYWYSVLPFHVFVFNGMITNIEKFRPQTVGD